ncbi:MAG: response regulator [Candidatus Pacebacteria bacterium]|nr:response regulator [Candidatus Paceibacterota bacterium]
MKILIVEDVKPIALRIAEVLRDLGHIVEIFGLKSKNTFLEFPKDVDKAKVMILESDVELVLLDQRLHDARTPTGEEVKYFGEKLLPGCAGKIVLGISSTDEQLGVHFLWKNKGGFNVNANPVLEDLSLRTLPLVIQKVVESMPKSESPKSHAHVAVKSTLSKKMLKTATRVTSKAMSKTSAKRRKAA